ncbi:tRNA (adenosine(37)-N6)-threonylcarbamoyltransferase complex dimerization subunit type 1 TsaB [uncultured Tateyamaria sp.]|uniref:tRNA (adenosine(37)-N6)-threonylcarbamoyltransferase complex dimerization subunit type 1 TsaB n=1 Tax=uncultured Tateyamaria sp. TaxID=455651 RepID=UPI00262807E0|nr:tRNA (adenosine(37)-N6)-threonylcarbamoyltransferase complex dimerization subunit type 1 TsaB [uncultured Tateyamaria sp.]
MASPPLILGFDTSGAYCAAALMRGGHLLGAVSEDMAKGQAERLMDLLQDLLKDHDTGWRDLNALAVGTGPGNFTGIRIGVSAARGLALGLGIPAYGVTGFEARARLAPAGHIVAIPAPRDMAYSMTQNGPQLGPLADIANPAPPPAPHEMAHAIAAHATTLWPAPTAPPAPYYLRAPDAAPARDAPPAILT